VGKFLFWAIVIVSALLFARLLIRQQDKSRNAGQLPPANSSGPAAKASPEAMVRCEHCGIHLPRSEAVLLNGRIGCCAEHAKLGHTP
jgi:uncharacterized protein